MWEKNDTIVRIEEDEHWMAEKKIGWFKRTYYEMVPWEKEENDGFKWAKL